LGLEAQREAVTTYARQVGEPIIGGFVEVESGAVKDRPELASALRLCRQKRATLLIAKLDRLSRSLSFVAQLLDSNVEIRAADVPEANRMMLQMLAVFAEHERRLIGERTKAALAAAKARGVKLGTNGAVLAARHKNEARARAESLRVYIDQIQADGITTFRGIAEALNNRSVRAPGGGLWYGASVRRVLQKLQHTSAQLR